MPMKREIKEEKRFGAHHWIKVGTMPGYSAWVKFPAGGAEVGKSVQFREGTKGPWTDARIWQIGPAPDYRLYLEL